MGNDEIENTGGFKQFKDRMGTIEEIETEKNIISEFNTRCRFVNEHQVQKLMGLMERNGFIPKCAVWVNAVTEDGTREGKVLQYRLMAGRHRHESASRLGMEKIPCQLFYNLTPKEECELDRLDNELDDTHEKTHFLVEAEHYKYLADVKKWSQREIAKRKGVSKSAVARKLKVANIPEEAKRIIRSGPDPAHFSETHFEEICKLKDPHIIAVCAKIAERGELAEKKMKDDEGKLIQPMKQSEIGELVEEYLEKEKKENVESPTEAPPQKQSLPKDEEELEIPIEEVKDATKSAARQLTEETLEIPLEFIHEIPGQTIKGMKLNMCTA